MRSKLKLTVLIVSIVVLTAAALIGFGVWHARSNTPTFPEDGYVLMGGSTEAKQFAFTSGSKYAGTMSGDIKITAEDGSSYTVPRESFVHLNTAGIMALSDGVLLNFDELAENFVQNYYINAGVKIARSGDAYAAQTTAGRIQFGEHLWKLSKDRYIIVSPELEVSLGGNTEPRKVADYIQVTVSPDGIVYLLTPENIWMTISETCCIKTAGGVSIYPLTQLIDNGEHKLSLAKLSVSLDDSIVLTEGETLLQIVPEFNITGVDGQDGQDGQSGASGGIGANGNAGQGGAEGAGGNAGTDGNVGADGTAGNQGAAGGIGAGGADGESGGNGQQGSSGTSGPSGLPGTAGSQGNSGGIGHVGAPGNTGAPGADAIVESSSNTALPTMTLTDWQVSATEIMGMISITDAAGMLEAMQGKDDMFPGIVTITNVVTGEVIPCYQVERDNDGVYDLGVATEGDDGFPGFYSTDQVAFATLGKPLTPDTEYRLSVRAYYTTTDNVGLVYCREFVSRIFYTDSTGVNLSYVSATTNSITINATLSPIYAGSVDEVEVFLLTPQQNKSFTASNVNSSSNDWYSAKVTISGAEFASSMTQQKTFVGNNTPLSHNTTYIARVYVKTVAVETLTKQALEVKTLKTAPEVALRGNEKEKPIVSYNRPSGAFEVYRPNVIDPDGGAVRYTYVAYAANESGQWVEKSRRTIPASNSGEVEFRLEASVDYQFGVILEFFDNEKTVYYDLGRSELIRAEGDTMPRMTLVGNASGLDYNKYVGVLTINLGANSKMLTGAATSPVLVELFADSLSSGAIRAELYEDATVFVNGVDNKRGTMTLKRVNSNTIEIYLDLTALYMNTNYAIAVSGDLDVGNGDGYIFRSIGTVTFKTYKPLPLIATFGEATDQESGGASLSRKLQLAVSKDSSNPVNFEAREAYAIQTLTGGGVDTTDPCGQVTVALYQGYGANMRPLAQMNFNEKDQLAALFGDGLVITEANFGNIAIDPGTTYTMAITSVSDSSFRNTELGYVNTYDRIINPTGTTAGVTQPPDLLMAPTTGVTATPIYNKDAAKFGAVESEILPEDAIIGYTLAATYSNVQRIATEVTYYAYEYSAYINALEDIKEGVVLQPGETICTKMQPLMSMTQPVSIASDTVPMVAILFGGDPATPPTDWNGYMVYYAGNANYTTSLQNGMGRGFRYIFAYEVKYAVGNTESPEGTVTLKTYPYDHTEYTDYKKLYGGLEVNERVYGADYVLTSACCEAPRILPDFHTYVYATEQADIDAWNPATPTSGTVILHYTWRDPEAENNPSDPGSWMVITDAYNPNATKITYETGNLLNPYAEVIVGNSDDQVAGEENWFEVRIPYIHTKANLAILNPTMNITEYRIDYSQLFGTLREDEMMKIGPIPVDWSWEEMFEMPSYEGVILQQVPHQDENYISFYLSGVADTFLTELASRATAMELTFSAPGAPTKTFLLPVIYDASGWPGVRVMTSQLGSDYLSTPENPKTYTVSNAVLYYDSGAQGWSLAQQNPALPLSQQYILMQLVDETGLLEYRGAIPSSDIYASGALAKPGTVDVAAGLRQTISFNRKLPDTKIGFQRAALISGYRSDLQYLYPTLAGVDSASSSDYRQLSGTYVIPKAVKTLSLTFGGDLSSTTGELKDLTPTVDYDYFGASTSTIYGNGLQVDGFPGKGEIYLAAYLNEQDAELLNDNTVQPPKKITVEANGTILDCSTATAITNLSPDQTYYITLFYRNSSGEAVHLIYTKTTEAFIHEVTTSDNVVITVRNVEYANRSYLDKELTVTFDMSIVYHQEVKYNIYKSQAGAENQDEDELVIGHDELLGNHVLSAPSVLSYYNNTLTFKLEPRTERSKLQPGATYYLRIDSKETGVDSDALTGMVIRSFSLDTLGTYGALIYLQNATSNSISFQVTINDPKYSLMNNDRLTGAKYVVRFTDANGKRIYTTYDDEVYSAFEAGALQHEFVLNSTTVYPKTTEARNPDGIQPQTPYQIHIYAVPDQDHNGIIALGSSPSDRYTWETIFENNNAGVMNFVAIVESFWNLDGTKNTSKASVEALLHIAQNQRSTTTESNWYFNEAGVYVTRVSPTRIRVNFSESVGLIKFDDPNNPQGTPIFQQIDWQVSGRADDGTSIIAGGTLRHGTDTLIEVTQRGGSDLFYLELPYDLPQGFYNIVIQFREVIGDEAAKITVSLTSGQ